MRCRSNSNRVVEILLLFFLSYIKKAVSLFGNVVITIKPYVMIELLAKATELPIEMYSSLTNPIFIDQTEMDDNFRYWIVVKSEEKLFKFHLNL